jgi:hypothetical protein
MWREVELDPYFHKPQLRDSGSNLCAGGVGEESEGGGKWISWRFQWSGADSARGSGSGVASQVPDRARRCFGVMSPNLALEAEQGDGVTKVDLFNLKNAEDW